MKNIMYSINAISLGILLSAFFFDAMEMFPGMKLVMLILGGITFAVSAIWLIRHER